MYTKTSGYYRKIINLFILQHNIKKEKHCICEVHLLNVVRYHDKCITYRKYRNILCSEHVSTQVNTFRFLLMVYMATCVYSLYSRYFWKQKVKFVQSGSMISDFVVRVGCTRVFNVLSFLNAVIFYKTFGKENSI